MKKLRLSIVIMLIIMLVSGCSNFGKQKQPAVVTIDQDSLSQAEVMIYLLLAKEEFEKVGGPDVWEIPKEDFTGGKTPQQVAKERAMDNLIRDKILVDKADGLNIKLDDQAIEETKAVAATYFEKIPQPIIEQYKITAQIVENSFLDFRLATEVSGSITGDYVPSEAQITEQMLLDPDYLKLKGHDAKDILTYVVFKRILTNTYELNTNNERVALSDEAQAQALNKINEAYRLAVNGQDFDELIKLYSEEDQSLEANNGEFRQSFALLSEELKKVFNALKIGQMSQVIKTEYGYQIFKLMAVETPTQDEITSYEEEFVNWEATLRTEAQESLKQQAFNEIYDEWKKEYTIKTNDELWNQMSIK